MLNNLVFIAFKVLDTCLQKFKVLSKVIPRSLNSSTTETRLPNISINSGDAKFTFPGTGSKSGETFTENLTPYFLAYVFSVE